MFGRKNKNFILVEDSLLLKKALKYFFKGSEYIFYDTYDELIKIDDPQIYNTTLFILDYHVVGDFTGLDFVKHLNDINSNIPCIIFMGMRDCDLINEFKKYKFVNDVIIKGDIDLNNLFKNIRKNYGV